MKTLASSFRTMRAGRLHICEILHIHGPLNLEDIIKKNEGHKFNTLRVLDNMLLDKQVEYDKCGMYSLTDDINSMIAERIEAQEKRKPENLVQSRTPINRPFNMKMYANVRERLNRDVCFKIGI